MSDQHLTIKGTLDAEELAGPSVPVPGGPLAGRGHRPGRAHAGRGPQLAGGHPPARGGRQAGRLRPLLELVPEDLLRDPEGSRGRDGPQGADEAPDRGQLVRYPAQGAAREIPPAGARPVGRGFRDRREPTGSPRRWRAGRSPPGTERGPPTDRRHLGGLRRLRRLLRVRVRAAAARRRGAAGAAAVLRAGRGPRSSCSAGSTGSCWRAAATSRPGGTAGRSRTRSTCRASPTSTRSSCTTRARPSRRASRCSRSAAGARC